MHFIGVLIDMVSGEILNANNVVNFATGINDFANHPEITIYPNPSQGKVVLKGTGFSKIQVWTTSGNLAYSSASSSEEIDLSGLEKGFYIAGIELPDGSLVTRKISIIK
jgi:hypothetical protein